MLTVIFLDDNNLPVSIIFRLNDQLDKSLAYGVWDTNNNHVDLNTEGWQLLQQNRKDIRMLKPMMDRLKRIPEANKALKFQQEY